MGAPLSRLAGLSRLVACACLTLVLLAVISAAGAFAAAADITEEEALRAADRELLANSLFFQEDLDLFERDVRLEEIGVGGFWVVSYTDVSGRLRERVVLSATSGALVTDKDVLQRFDAWEPYVSRYGAVGSWTWAIVGIVMSGVVGFGAYRWLRKPRLGWRSWLVNGALGSYAAFVTGGVLMSALISDTRGTLVCLLCVALLAVGAGFGLKKRGRWGLVQIPAEGAIPSAVTAVAEVPPAENSVGPSTAADRGQMARTRADEPSPLTVIPPEKLPCFRDVGGMDDVKRQLKESVGLLVSHGDLARQYRLDWNGVLLYGPPGVGKTFMAKAAAGEFGLNFIDIRVSDVLSSSFGGSAKLISAVFGEAKLRRPCILFFDEFDSIAQRREQALFDTENVRIVNQLLRELEAARTVPDLIVMAATNFKDSLDEAITRPGRFDRHIAIGMPDEAARRTIIEAQLTGRPLGTIDIEELIRRTDNMSAADITAVVNTAALEALRQSASGAAPEGAVAVPLGHGELLGAIDAMRAKVKSTVQFASWDDLVLDGKTLTMLKEVQRFIEEFEDLKLRGIEMPRGVLLYGPPGTGKTTIARVLASQANASFFSANASELTSMWVGESEKHIARLFAEARKHRPSIIFIDEIDSLVKRRSGGTWSDAQTNQFLREIDGVTSTPGVFVIGATNLTSSLDPALLRGGRLSRQILIPLPDEDGRRRLFEVHARDLERAADVDFAVLARKTDKMSGADIRDICQAAAMRAFSRDSAEVSASDFAEALKQYVADRPEFNAPGWAPKLDSSEKPQKKIKIGFAPPIPEETAANDDPAEPPTKG